MDTGSRNKKVWIEVLVNALGGVLSFGALMYTLRMCLKQLDPYREQREEAKKRTQLIRQRLGRPVDLDEFEQLLAVNVMNPNHIDVTTNDIMGLDHIVQDLEVKVFAPMQHSDYLTATLWRQTKGVLLFGPPGTGKTMLVKALAKESGCFFLNVTPSSIMSKWLGDTNRLVRAIFSLARKLQPCIIFIDEVDALLGKRGGQSEHEASLQAKTEFMQLWDGIESSVEQRVVVMGATNRPQNLDEAVLRRFTLQYEIGLPSEKQRQAIISGYLLKHIAELGQDKVDSELLADMGEENIYGSGSAAARSQPGASSPGAVGWIAGQTEGFSGSDLMELCKQAAQQVLQQFYLEQKRARNRGGEAPELNPRPLTRHDFEEALATVRPSQQKADAYSKAQGSTFNLSVGGNANILEYLKTISMLNNLKDQLHTGAERPDQSGGSPESSSTKVPNGEDRNKTPKAKSSENSFSSMNGTSEL